jgi:hypothetical protein
MAATLLLVAAAAPRAVNAECRALGSFDLRFRGGAAECTVDRARADAAVACIDKQVSLLNIYSGVRPCTACSETGGRSFIVQNFYGPSTWSAFFSGGGGGGGGGFCIAAGVWRLVEAAFWEQTRRLSINDRLS